MPSRKNRFDDTLGVGSSRNAPIGAGNVGRKLLEKMGWTSGLGLGKDNQGMIENPLWKNTRDAFCKIGFKSKEEKTPPETLTHQSAFEDLLGNLNAGCESHVESAKPSQPISSEKARTSKRKARYVKMARAKDISNYSAEDFKGIIGKVVAEKNFRVLRSYGSGDDGNTIFKETIVNDGPQMSTSYSEVNKRAAEQQKKMFKVDGKTPKHLSFITTEKESMQQNQDGSRKKRKKYCTSEINVIADSKDSLNVFQNGKVYVSSNSDLEETTYSEHNQTIEQTSESENSGMKSKKSKRKKKKKEKSEGIDEIHPDEDHTHDTEMNMESRLKSDSPAFNLRSKTTVHKKFADCKDSVGNNRSDLLDPHDTKDEESNKLHHSKVKKKKDKQKPAEREKRNLDNDIPEVDGNTHLQITKNSAVFRVCKAEISQKEPTADPETLNQISESFVGSNLLAIKGYGNW